MSEISTDDFLRWVYQGPGKTSPPPSPTYATDHTCWHCSASMLTCFQSWANRTGHCCQHCEHGMQVSQRGYSYASARAEGHDETQALDLSVQPEDVQNGDR